MYKILSVKDEVRVDPTKFNLDINEAIKQSLQEQIEGKLNPEVGIFLAVTDVLEVSEGKILPEDGAIHYTAEFKVLTFVPEINEIVHGEIVETTKFGAFARIGPIDAMVHVSQIMDDKTAFNQKESMFTGKKTGLKLKEKDVIRGRIVSVSLGKGGKSKISLTMRQPTLGALDWVEKEKKKGKK